MNVKDVEFAVWFAQALRKDMIEDGANLSDWNINIDKIVEHSEEIKKLNPSNRYKFLMFLHENDIITPTEQGKRVLNGIISR
jgi:hypothetical protein